MKGWSRRLAPGQCRRFSPIFFFDAHSPLSWSLEQAMRNKFENSKNAYDMRNNQLIEVAFGIFLFLSLLLIFLILVRQWSNIFSASVFNSLFAGYFTGAPVIQVSTSCMMIMHDWRKFWKRFRGCFVFDSRVSTKTVVMHVICNLQPCEPFRSENLNFELCEPF